MNATRIVIAHRLSTIRDADRIVVLEGGRIAEIGTYDELMAKGGAFQRLAQRQLLYRTSSRSCWRTIHRVDPDGLWAKGCRP